jgi:hypothetical protein
MPSGSIGRSLGEDPTVGWSGWSLLEAARCDRLRIGAPRPSWGVDALHALRWANAGLPTSIPSPPGGPAMLAHHGGGRVRLISRCSFRRSSRPSMRLTPIAVQRRRAGVVLAVAAK